MRWAFIAITLVALGVVFSAPFWSYLAPDEFVMLSMYKNGELITVARGAETLWYQWQTWSYIFLLCIPVMVMGNMIGSMFRMNTDKKLSEKKQELNDQITELEKTQSEFKKETTESILTKYDARRVEYERLYYEAVDKNKNADKTLNEANIKMAKANKIIQQRKGLSVQLVRLRAERLDLIYFLEEKAWHIEGAKLDYNLIRKMSKGSTPEDKRKTTI